MKKSILIVSVLVSILFVAKAYSHCQLPCGIYDDHMRIHMMEENVTTIDLSINKIKELEKVKNPNHNQLVRWVMNKEKHADKLSKIATQYFMSQRLKPVEDEKSEAFMNYIKQLTLLHQITVYSMKAKQTLDVSHVETLRTLISDFEKLYLKDESKQ